jgi:hypothetical protein
MSLKPRIIRSFLIPAALTSLVACSAPDQDLSPAQDPLVQGQTGTSDPSTPPPSVDTSAFASVQLAGMAFSDPFTSQWTTVTTSNGQMVWPNPFDLDPHWVHFAWKPIGGFSATEIQKLATGDGYHLDLYLNGEKLTPGPNGNSGDFFVGTIGGDAFGCPTGQSCLATTFPGSKIRSYPGTWTLKLVFWKTAALRGAVIAGPAPGVESRTSVTAQARLAPVPETQPAPVASAADKPIAKTTTSVGTVSPHPNPVSFFQATMVPIFRHQNCATCHSLGSAATLAAHHHGLLYENQITTTVTPRGTQLRCGSGCHGLAISYVVKNLPQANFLETEWMAPASDMDLNWSTKSDQQICATIKSNLSSGAATLQHFSGDARVAWAVTSGELPQNLSSHPTAPPHDYDSLQQIIYAWIDSGRRCP